MKLSQYNGRMIDIRLSDDDWMKIRDFLRLEPRASVGRDEQACRRFVEAVKWMSRSGAQWRLLPGEYGPWNSVYKRFARWCEAGVWERLLAALADDPDWEHGMLDSTSVRAHPCAAGAQKNTVRKPSDAVAAGSAASCTSLAMG